MDANFLKTDRAGTCRIEIFHVTADPTLIKHTPVPQIPFCKMIKAVICDHINFHMVDQMKSALEPLMQTFVRSRPDSGTKNYHCLSPEAKVSLMYHAELVAQILEIPSYSKPILDQMPKVLDSPVIISAPLSSTNP